jgi:hypothetical protein
MADPPLAIIDPSGRPVGELSAGATAAETAHPACVFTGARRCEYQVTWTRAP